jgi:hypothetical protein
MASGYAHQVVKTNRKSDWPKMLRALEGFLEANGHFRVEERRKHNPTLAGLACPRTLSHLL